MPTDLVDAAGAAAADRPLVYEMSRPRTVVVPPRYSQDEVALVRRFRVPDARAFARAGHGAARHRRARRRARRGARHPRRRRRRDHRHVVAAPPRRPRRARLVGVRRRSRRPRGAPRSARRSGSGSTWSRPQPVTFDHLDLQVVADGQHSVPTQLRIDAGGESRTVDVPAITDARSATRPGRGAGAVRAAHRIRRAGHGHRRPRRSTRIEYHEHQPIAMPVAIAEVGIPGVSARRATGDAPGGVPHRSARRRRRAGRRRS